jgi:two-component system nitrogen regulation response regulator GlnG
LNVSPNATPKPTILIVDEELAIRESFTLILEDQARIISVATGEAAVKRFADESVDLVFLDIRMPGMDGIEVLKRIKAIDASVPVVMVTAVNDVQKASACVRAGAFNYIVKPFDIDQILEMARQLIAPGGGGR